MIARPSSSSVLAMSPIADAGHAHGLALAWCDGLRCRERRLQRERLRLEEREAHPLVVEDVDGHRRGDREQAEQGDDLVAPVAHDLPHRPALFSRCADLRRAGMSDLVSGSETTLRTPLSPSALTILLHQLDRLGLRRGEALLVGGTGLTDLDRDRRRGRVGPQVRRLLRLARDVGSHRRVRSAWAAG